MTAPVAKRMGWGLVGVGRHAERFIVPAMGKSASGQLVGVFSRDMGRARQLAERLGCPLATDSIDALVEDARIHAVYVCSPNNAHKDQVVRAAKAGKHVLCEKPLATNARDSLTMVEACRQAGVKLGVGFHLRHNPVHMAAKESVRSGVLGTIQLAEVQYMHVTAGSEGRRQSVAWRRDPIMAGGGSFMSTGVHAIDLLRFVTGKEITQVLALADEEWRSSGIERLIQVSMVVEGDTLASASAGPMKHPLNHLVLYGASATLRCTGSIGNNGGGSIEIVSDDGTQIRRFDTCDVYEHELDAFADSVRNGTEPSASGYDALRVAQIAEGVYESLRTGRAVPLPADL